MEICKAPEDHNQIRCSQMTNGISDHCKFHFDKFNKLYLKYKKHNSDLLISNFDQYKDEFKNYSLTKLMKLYAKIEKVIELRVSYRDLAYMKEFHDSGHNGYIRILFRYLSEINDIIASKHSLTSDLINQNSESDISTDLPEIEIISSNRIKKVIDKININDQEIFDYYSKIIKQEKEFQTQLKLLKKSVFYPFFPKFKEEKTAEKFMFHVVGCLTTISRYIIYYRYDPDESSFRDISRSRKEIDGKVFYCEIKVILKFVFYNKEKLMKFFDKLANLIISNEDRIYEITDVLVGIVRRKNMAKYILSFGKKQGKKSYMYSYDNSYYSELEIDMNKFQDHIINKK